jgi:hypothetical protein
MSKKTSINVGTSYVAMNATQRRWSVANVLADGVHLVLVCDDEPSLRKTVSVSALLDSRYFAPAQPKAA